MGRYIDADRLRSVMNCYILDSKKTELSKFTMLVAKDMVDMTPTADVIEREKIDKALNEAYKIREEVLHLNEIYSPNDVLQIIDDISKLFEEI